MIIGIIHAMEQEGTIIDENLRERQKINIKGSTFIRGKIGFNDIILTNSGIGKVNSTIAATLMITYFKPDLIINTGIAGGSRLLNTNDIIVADKLAFSDFDLRAFGYQFGKVPGFDDYFKTSTEYMDKIKAAFEYAGLKFKTVPILSADKFINSHTEIHRKYTVPYAVDMEGASIAQTCNKMNVPFVSIRFISDILDSANHLDNYHAFEENACKNSAKITLNILKNL